MWLAADNKLKVLQQSNPQYITSQKCSSIRGGLLALQQALDNIAAYLQLKSTSPQHHNIIICSYDGKLLRKIKNGTRQYKTAKNMLSEEQGLFEELHPLLQSFHTFQLHRNTKRNDPHSVVAFVVAECLSKLKSANNLVLHRYSPTGPATLWHQAEEVSHNLEITLRHASTSINMRQYMQTKYK